MPLVRPGSKGDKVALAILVCGTALALYAFLVEPYWIAVTRLHVPAPVARKLVIAHVADLHTYGLGRREETLLGLLERERPDVIVLSGDHLVDGDLRSPPLGLPDDPSYAMAAPVLRRLSAPLGVYAVRGNWEVARHTPDERGFYAGVGVRLLVNQAAQLVPGVWLAGLDDAGPNAEEAAREVPAGAYVVAFFHSPAIFDRVAGRWPLALAGHTHGGQVVIPFWGAPWLPPGSEPYTAGTYLKLESQLHVSRGIGTAILPVRFACRPELVLVTLTPDS